MQGTEATVFSLGGCAVAVNRIVFNQLDAGQRDWRPRENAMLGKDS